VLALAAPGSQNSHSAAMALIAMARILFTTVKPPAG
jgi:hypothetical protein